MKMKTMKAFAGVVSLSMLLLGGCSKKDDVVGSMQKMADKACACKDAKCIEGLKAEGEKMKASMSKEAVEKLSDADKKKVAEIGNKMAECMLKAAMGGGEEKK